MRRENFPCTNGKMCAHDVAVAYDLAKVDVWVRLPLGALERVNSRELTRFFYWCNMEIVCWTKSGGGQMVRVTREEALQIISSLSQQLLSRDINTDRAEFTDQNGKYFSIAVHDKSCNPHCPIAKALKEDAQKKLLEEDFNHELREPEACGQH